MVKRSAWRAKKDPLLRGDRQTLSTPDPGADPSIVRHVLFLGGAGRPTPYHSTTEERGVAEDFARPNGRVWTTSAAQARSTGTTHIPRLELLSLLRGSGKGDAKWSNAFEVMQARRYVELWSEHLLSYRHFTDAKAASAAAASAFT